ncbi:MAG: hypothetical protein KDB54_05025 [Solirubrobacterales bacterium]|nr:hypothetical protein [Solirubrobacterales bacterium]
MAAALCVAGMAILFGAGKPSLSKAAETAGDQASGSVIPCGRPVILTAVYRKEGRIRFEGVSDPGFAGKTVRIFSRQGDRVATGKVDQDGIFWASADSRVRRYTWLSGFMAKVGGQSSRWRRLGQAVGMRERKPVTLPATRGSHGKPRKRTRVTVKVTGEEKSLVVIGLQTGCSRFDVRELASTYTDPNGVTELNLPRPTDGSPYAIYRVSTEDDWKISPPIVVRALDTAP